MVKAATEHWGVATGVPREHPRQQTDVEVISGHGLLETPDERELKGWCVWLDEPTPDMRRLRAKDPTCHTCASQGKECTTCD